MGGERSISSMHKDHYENLYGVVRGSKTFILHPPTDLFCIPYKQYNLARYKKIDGEYVIKDEYNAVHCERCIISSGNSTNSQELTGLVNKNIKFQDQNEHGAYSICGDGTMSEISVCVIDDESIHTIPNEDRQSKGIVISELNNPRRTAGTEVSVRESCSTGGSHLNCLCQCHQPTVPWISIDPLSADSKHHELYTHSNPLVVTVNDGDLLYLPSLWFHHVQQTDHTIAVNFWYDMEYDIKYNYFKFAENIIESIS